MNTPIISFRDFTFQYRAQARPTLYNINLDIYPGETHSDCRAFRQRKIDAGKLRQRPDPVQLSRRVRPDSLLVDGVDAPHSKHL